MSLALACGVAGLAFGMFMDVYQWTLAARQDLPTYLAVSASSLPYNVAHAIGNVAFCLLLGPLFIGALRRYRRRFEVSWPAPGGARATAVGGATAALGVAIAVALTLAGAPEEPARAAVSPASKAARYLTAAQNRDGGFGAARGQSSNQLFTGWSALGLAAAGRNPRDVGRRGERSITTYLRRAGSIGDTGEIERTILVLRAAGLSPRSFGDRDLVAELVRRRRSSGSWRGNVAPTAFGILALRAAGRRGASLRRSAAWLERAQSSDGGFGLVPDADSDVDNTGAALQALAAAGRRRGSSARQAVAYLRSAQNRDGGWGQSRGRSSNAQSTAWAVQGLVAAGAATRGPGGDPVRYLVRLQRRDGHIAYSRTSNQTPVWVTAQALTALRRRPFPLAAVPRRQARRAAVAEAGSASASAQRKRQAKAKEEAARSAPTGRASASREREPSTVSSAPTAARSPSRDDAGGASPAVLAAAVGVALGGVWLARRRLRRRAA